MKKILLQILFVILSITAFGQAGSLSQSVYRSRVLDSTSVTTPIGWGLLYFNTQRSPAAWVFSNDNGVTWHELGSGTGGGAGTVTSVSGTSNRVTVANGTTTPVIDISATFEGLLGKVAQRIDQNNASTTSAQLATTLSDESGTGVVAYTNSPSFTTPSLGAATATTAAAGTNSTHVATTAFVMANSPKVFAFSVTDDVSPIGSGTGKISFRLPYAMTVTACRCSLVTAQASGSIFTVDINEAGTSILSTKLTIDNTETTSTTAATAPVISDSSLADDALITVDVDGIGNGSAIGLKCVLIGN